MVRKTARKISQYYDVSMREAGIRVTQFFVLAALANMGSVTLSQLAGALGLDRTGLTRNLSVLERHGWIEIQAGTEDSRQRIISLSDKGYEKLDFAIPYWEKAQSRIEDRMGATSIKRMRNDLRNLNAIVSK